MIWMLSLLNAITPVFCVAATLMLSHLLSNPIFDFLILRLAVMVVTPLSIAAASILQFRLTREILGVSKPTLSSNGSELENLEAVRISLDLLIGIAWLFALLAGPFSYIGHFYFHFVAP